MAVWGWSYGGFTAAMALAREQEVFHCGISVAPVTTWRLYGEFKQYELQCGLDKAPLHYTPPEVGRLCKCVNVIYTERAQDQHSTHSIWHII